MKEAMLYEKGPNQTVSCAVCANRCHISPGKRGLCGVRENRGGTLYALNYGRTIAMHVDPIEKKPLKHYMRGTMVYSFASAGCNMNCPWCQNWEIAHGPKTFDRIEGIKITPDEHVKRAVALGVPLVAYTYTEPTVYLEYALETMTLARAMGLKNIWVTNGYMTPEALAAIIPYLDAANVDFKGMDDPYYVKTVLENLKAIRAAGIHLEITTLIVPGVNDHEEQMTRMAQSIVQTIGKDVPWHISRFFPAWQMLTTPITPIETLELAKKIAEKVGIKYIFLGNV